VPFSAIFAATHNKIDRNHSCCVPASAPVPDQPFTILLFIINIIVHAPRHRTPIAGFCRVPRPAHLPENARIARTGIRICKIIFIIASST